MSRSEGGLRGKVNSPPYEWLIHADGSANILPKSPLRVDFLAQIRFCHLATIIILSVQKDPAGRLLTKITILSAQRARCGKTFWLEIRFCLTISSTQKTPAGRPSGSKYDFVCLKAPCGSTFSLKFSWNEPFVIRTIQIVEQVRLALVPTLPASETINSFSKT